MKNNGGTQQINGREGETATFLKAGFGFPHVAWWRFRPTSSQSLGCLGSGIVSCLEVICESLALAQELRSISSFAQLTHLPEINTQSAIPEG
jgi:hypothetical protein